MNENLDVSGLRADDEESIPTDSWLYALRGRALAHARPPSWPRALKFGALAIALIAHMLLGLWLAHLMRPPLPVDDGRVEVRLIEAVPPEPALPEPNPLPHIQMPAIQRTDRPAIAANPRNTPDAPPSPPALHLYNPDGSIALPPPNSDALIAHVAPDAFVPQSTAPSSLMGPHRPLKMRPNHFAGAWKSGKTIDLFERLNELIDDHLTVKKDLTTPWGSKIKCQAIYLVVIAVGGCGWGLPPPPGGRPTEHWKPATELDEK